jgi:acyl carrier protein
MSQDARTLVLRALASVAPEIDFATLDPHTSIRDQYDFDSVDFFNFIVAIHAETGVDIPEADYSKVESVDQCVDYLSRATGANQRS